jgi:pyrroline-5-carboxylate reductase
MNAVIAYLKDAKLGIFGAGHLGQALALSLLYAGLPNHRLALCHNGSPVTRRKLVQLGLGKYVFDPATVASSARVLFYTVRPALYKSIAGHTLKRDAVFVSFLAGVPLGRIPLVLADRQKVRVMTSGPETIQRQRGVAAYFPGDSAAVAEILSALNLKLFAMTREDELDAFTAFGPCLHIALTEWERMGHSVNEAELFAAAKKFHLARFDELLEWARSAQPRYLSSGDLVRYMAQAATPGGVTEAILDAIHSGSNLSGALAAGVERCRNLCPD